MECIGSWLDNIMGAISLAPQLFQCCMAFGGSTGFIGCLLASGSQVMSAIHCAECLVSPLGSLIDPVFEKMREDIEGVFAK